MNCCKSRYGSWKYSFFGIFKIFYLQCKIHAFGDYSKNPPAVTIFLTAITTWFHFTMPTSFFKFYTKYCFLILGVNTSLRQYVMFSFSHYVHMQSSCKMFPHKLVTHLSYSVFFFLFVFCGLNLPTDLGKHGAYSYFLFRCPSLYKPQVRFHTQFLSERSNRDKELNCIDKYDRIKTIDILKLL